MHDMLFWLALALAWFWRGGWLAVLLFIAGWSLCTLGFARLFLALHTWRMARKLGSYAALVEQITYEPVREAGAPVAWRKASRDDLRCTWPMDCAGQANQIVAQCWMRYESEEKYD